MTLGEFLAGAEILRPYYDDPNGYHLGADHDVIYVYNTDRPVLPADLERLAAMGWQQDNTSHEDGEWRVADYDPEESWWAYV